MTFSANPLAQSLRSFTRRRVSTHANHTNEKDHHLNARISSSSSSNQSSSSSSFQWNEWYPREEAIANPPLANGHDTFSACLLVMDDNHRLMEWMAYHYHVLPLRYLIVATDPRSITSPTAILNRWRRQGVHIVQWNDTDFWPVADKLRPIPDDAPLQVKRDRHRGRQKYFYRQCLIHAKKDARSWVALHDTDEYLVYNHAGGERYEAWEEHRQLLHDQTMAAEAAAHPEAVAANNKHRKRIKPSQTPPTTAEAGAMIRYIRQEQAAGLAYYQKPCIGVPRLTFSAQESTPEEWERAVPAHAEEYVNVRELDTLRYRKHAHRNDFVKNALGKVLLDVSRIDMERTAQFMSLHRPIKRLCPAPWHNDWEVGLRINHYLGSWESYSFRTNDARKGFERSYEQWEYKSLTNADATDDNIRPWFRGFVRDHGWSWTREMLYQNGVPPQYQPRDEEWHLLPDKLEQILAVNETKAQDNKQVAFDAFVRKKYSSSGGGGIVTERRR